MKQRELCRQCKVRPPSRPGRPFCSKACSNASRKLPLAIRFARYFREGEPDACWPWLGTRDREGYGVIGDEHHRQHRAHRIAYERANGAVRQEEHVLHRCDNPPCCNPAHLRIGTPQDNMTDKVNRGRQPRGIHHGIAKLTNDAVRDIRIALRAGTLSMSAIGRKHGVSYVAIRCIRDGRTWAHVR